MLIRRHVGLTVNEFDSKRKDERLSGYKEDSAERQEPRDCALCPPE